MNHVLMRYCRRVNIFMALEYTSIMTYSLVLYFMLLCSVFCRVSFLLHVYECVCV
jgi:hypothetical protein